MPLNVNDNYIVQSADYLKDIDDQRLPGAELKNIDGARMNSASQILSGGAHYSGETVTVRVDDVVNLGNLVIDIRAQQPGAGTQTLNHPQPITGWDGAEITIVNGDNTQIVNVSFAGVGTIYGGTLDVITGALVVDMLAVDLGALDWSFSTPDYAWVASVPGKLPEAAGTMMCSCYAVSYTGIVSNGYVVGVDGTNQIKIRDYGYGANAHDAFVAAITGQMLVYKIATSEFHHIAANPIALQSGDNTISADTGNILDMFIPVYPLENIWQILY